MTIKSCMDFGEWKELNDYNKNNNDFNENILNKIKFSIYGMNNNESKINIDKKIYDLKEYENNINFSYYFSLLYLKINDYDKSYIFYQKSRNNLYSNWLNYNNNYNENQKHSLIYQFQLIFELGEFLNFIRGTSVTNNNILNNINDSDNKNNNNINLSKTGISNLINLYEKWINRWPNYLYDDSKEFNEIFQSRNILNSILSKKILNYENILNNNPIIDTFIVREFIEISKLLYKKNEIDLAEKNIKLALN